jgi:ATP phosphoribosyltransferase regulatory subunit
MKQNVDAHGGRTETHMSELLSGIPGGMRYYFGEEARLRRAVEDEIISVFQGWSYEEITTPTLDYYALFERGMGERAAQSTFRFVDTDGRLLALRPDVTSSIARAAATLLASLTRPLRLCYAAQVFRQRPLSHTQWRREVTQLGCELIGTNSSASDIEMVLIAVEVLRKLGFTEDFRITLNHVGVFNGITEQLALKEDERVRMRELIDVRDSADLRRFLFPLTGEEKCVALSRLVRLAGKREVLDEARRLVTSARAVRAIDALDRLWGDVESLGLAGNFEVDLGDVSDLDYYSGLVFKIYVRGSGARVGSGGRYDRLTANFGKPEHAVGFVLDLDALTDLIMKCPDRMSCLRGFLRPETTHQVVQTEANDVRTLFLDLLEKRGGAEHTLAPVGPISL